MCINPLACTHPKEPNGTPEVCDRSPVFGKNISVHYEHNRTKAYPHTATEVHTIESSVEPVLLLNPFYIIHTPLIL